jgi:uncharacterized protein (TIGR02147 family)
MSINQTDAKLDYRAWLKEIIRKKPKQGARLTLDKLASNSGCFTKSHLSLILAGKRNLNEEKAAHLGKAAGLRGEALAYFERLVRFNQAKNSAAKERYLSELAWSKNQKAISDSTLNDARALANWHSLVVLEFVRANPSIISPILISHHLRRLLTAADVKRALALLESLGAISIEGSQIIAKDLVWRSSDEVVSLSVRNYHRSCLQLSERVLDIVPIDDREFSSVNVALSNEGIKKVKTRIKALREEILHLAAEESGANRVCQLNVQFFSLNQNPERIC